MEIEKSDQMRVCSSNFIDSLDSVCLITRLLGSRFGYFDLVILIRLAIGFGIRNAAYFRFGWAIRHRSILRYRRRCIAGGHRQDGQQNDQQSHFIKREKSSQI